MEFKNLSLVLKKIVDEYKAPSVDCIVYKDHELLYREFYGKTDIENNVEVTGKELYYIFSMTKMITCTLALTLLEKGKYLLSDPLWMYLPEFKNMRVTTLDFDDIQSGKYTHEEIYNNSKTAKNDITIRDLFTMSAGLNYVLSDDVIKNAIAEGKTTTRELVGQMANKVLYFESGTRFLYSLCHDVLGALIEVWSGKSFGEYLEEVILKPLNMKNTFFGPANEETLSKMPPLYIYDENKEPKRIERECRFILTPNYQSGGAGLISTCEDYALFLDMIASGGVTKDGVRIISKSTIDLMKTDHMTGKRCADFEKLREGYGYGLGVRTHIDKVKSGSLSPIGEFGWDGAAGSFSMVDSENKISLTLFKHIQNWDRRYQNELRNALYSDLNM